MTAAGDAFLTAFHGAHPGCTSASLARGWCDDGRSSYERLADVADAPGRVLDLGCGDGYLLEALLGRGRRGADLVGVDFSAGELSAARRRLDGRGVALIRADAARIPLATGATACVVSHLAFMLMSDIDAVVGEVARVLAPGGVFAAVVGGGPKAGDAFELFLDVARPFIEAAPHRVPRLGHLRARRATGLAQLFSSTAGFEGAPEIEDFYLHVDGTPAEVWEALRSTYELAPLDGEARAALRSEFEARAAAMAGADGRVPCTMAMRMFRCRRAPAGPAKIRL